MRSAGGRKSACMKITAVIVDDEQPARDELVFLLKGFPDIELVGQGKNGLEALNLIRELGPQLVFLDVQMPGLDGVGVIRSCWRRRRASPFSSLPPPTTT